MGPPEWFWYSPIMSESDQVEPGGDPSFEAAIEELESIVTRIESGTLDLDASLALHRRGQALLKTCRHRLDAAEQELKTIGLGDLPAAEAVDADGD